MVPTRQRPLAMPSAQLGVPEAAAAAGTDGICRSHPPLPGSRALWAQEPQDPWGSGDSSSHTGR